jgi:hypothetical protein
MKPSIESKLRTIIREEIEYAFSKLTKRLQESTIEKKPIQAQQKPLRDEYRKKFTGLMESISEGIDLNEEISSEGITTNHLQNNPKLNAVQKAMTRNYSELIKKMDSK